MGDEGGGRDAAAAPAVAVRVLKPGVSGEDLARERKEKAPMGRVKNPRKTTTCSVCGKPGHNARGCTQERAGVRKSGRNGGGRMDDLALERLMKAAEACRAARAELAAACQAYTDAARREAK